EDVRSVASARRESSGVGRAEITCELAPSSDPSGHLLPLWEKKRAVKLRHLRPACSAFSRLSQHLMAMSQSGG
ncbi:hypothetical protein, partial [Agrobacterium genomosp. 13]|uniref:hypothetical protein n=1 Tax=Agrobacterium genomosp. 13 TaxID=1183419 RepID=UPI001ABFB842